jgi:glycosyltransferase involved in cell wall biosynthesis
MRYCAPSRTWANARMPGETADVRLTQASPAAALVSVTVPTYNHAAFIADCLDSILEQDYPAIEIIVADDRSEDATASIAEKYAAHYPDKIRLLSSDVRLGITVNANRAWLACSGKYVSTMAGDDLMRPGKLSRQVQLMEADAACSLCYHDLDVFDSQAGETLYRWNQVRGHPPLEGSAENIIVFGTFIGACSAMVRRSSAPTAGFDPRIQIASDWSSIYRTVPPPAVHSIKNNQSDAI